MLFHLLTDQILPAVKCSLDYLRRCSCRISNMTSRCRWILLVLGCSGLLISIWLYQGSSHLLTENKAYRTQSLPINDPMKYQFVVEREKELAETKERTSTSSGVPTQATTKKISNSNDMCNESHPIKHIVFTKVEKTGSTTMMSMLTKFAKNHNLNVIAQKSGNFLSWKQARGEGWVIGPGNVDRADLVTSHAIYNKTMMDKYMVKGYKLIGIAREPVSWYKSWVRFLGGIPEFRQQNPKLCTGTKMTYTAEDVLLKDNSSFYIKRQGISGLKTWFHLIQLQWYGFDYGQRNNVTAITEHIAWTLKEMDFIILTELYDASLVMLRRRFCWKYTDIFYKKYTVQKPAKVQLSSKAINRFLSAEYNLGEKLLYDKMNETWWKQPELKENDFWEEVTHFRELNKVVADQCKKVVMMRKSHEIPANQWHGPIILTRDYCSEFAKQGSISSYALKKKS